MNENDDIKKAKEELDKISQDAKERRLAELREKALMDEIAIRDSGYNEGQEDAKLEIAKNMLKSKMDIKVISEVTGMSIEEIQNISK